LQVRNHVKLSPTDCGTCEGFGRAMSLGIWCLIWNERVWIWNFGGQERRDLENHPEWQDWAISVDGKRTKLNCLLYTSALNHTSRALEGRAISLPNNKSETKFSLAWQGEAEAKYWVIVFHGHCK
jgi:hypothetical protein